MGFTETGLYGETLIGKGNSQKNSFFSGILILKQLKGNYPFFILEST